MADHNPTNEQKIAQLYDRNMAVNANAGSGKTSVLVKRFVQILISETKFNFKSNNSDKPVLKPSELVAITFTKKAAAEMLSKVIKEVEDNIAKEKKPEDLKFLRKIREKLTNARISTIHSFCSEILRNYSVEAGISPNFFEIPQAELLKMQNDAILQTFDEWIDSIDDRKAKINSLFNAISKRQVEEVIKLLLNKSEIYENLKENYSKGFDYFEGIKANYYLNLLGEVEKGVIELINYILKSDPNEIKKAHIENYHFLIDEIKAINNILKKESDDNFSSTVKKLKAIDNLINKVFTSTKSLRKQKEFSFLNNNYIQDRGIKLYRDDFKRFLKFSDTLEFDESDKKLFDYAKDLLDLTDAVFVLVDEQKSFLEGLDFNDLIIKTKKLLDDPAIAEQIRKKIKYLLIDEFQDTNDIQYDIVKSLVPDLIEFSFLSGVNLYLVGDEKQSIYGFRNADVRVFNQARYDISNLNKHLLSQNLISNKFNYLGEEVENISQDFILGKIALSSTFRLQPMIASFVNVICGKAMDSGESDYEVDYQKLSCGRNVESLSDYSDLNSEYYADKHSGSVSVLITTTKTGTIVIEDDEEQFDEQTLVTEAGSIARYINNIVNSDKPLKYLDEGIYKDVQYKDIAILSRRKKNFSELAAEFSKLGIPFVLSGGTNYFETQEILDIVSYLNFIVNSDDDLALSSLLYSDFFRLTQTDISLIFKHNFKGCLWLKFGDLIKSETIIDENLSRAYRLLNDLKLYSGFLTITQNINRLISLTGWYGFISGSGSKSQIIANINKMIRYARDYENKGYNSLYDFVQHLNFVSTANNKESEAMSQSDSNAVNVMSVHAAKGLEFPVVIIYDTNTKANIPSQNHINKEEGISFNFKVNTENENVWRKIKSPMFAMMGDNNAMKDLAEEKRVLYVALTRAKDHLIISIPTSKKNDGTYKLTGFAKLVMEGLGKEKDNLEEIEKFEINDLLPILKNGNNSTVEIKYCIPLINNVIESELIKISELPKDTTFYDLTHEFAEEYSDEIFSATRITAFENDTNSYIKRYLLGFPDEINFRSDLSIDDSGRIVVDKDEIPATRLGSIVHSMFENINFWYIEYNPDDNKLKELIKKELGDVSDDKEVVVKEIVKLCLNVVKTDYFANYKTEILEGSKELELLIPFSDDMIIAKIDLITRDVKGNSVVWDWKTNRIKDENHRVELEKHYEFQMKFYAYVLSYQFPHQQNFYCKLVWVRIPSSEHPLSEFITEFSWNRSELETFGQEIENKVQSMKRIWNTFHTI